MFQNYTENIQYRYASHKRYLIYSAPVNVIYMIIVILNPDDFRRNNSGYLEIFSPFLSSLLDEIALGRKRIFGLLFGNLPTCQQFKIHKLSLDSVKLTFENVLILIRSGLFL